MALSFPAVQHHPIMEPADGPARGGDEKERQETMDQTGHTAKGHAQPERAGHDHMRTIAFAHGSRVAGEKRFQHVLILSSEAGAALDLT